MPISAEKNRGSIVRRASVAAIIAGTLSVSIVSCGKESQSTAPERTSSTPVPATDSLSLELSGGMNAAVNTFSKAPECRWYPAGQSVGGDPRYSFRMFVNFQVDGRGYTLAVSTDNAQSSERTYRITSVPNSDPLTTGQISVYLNDAILSNSGANNNRWNTILVEDEGEVTGTWTVAAGRSGTIDATLSRTKGKPGGPLKIKGSWSCATVLGKK